MTMPIWTLKHYTSGKIQEYYNRETDELKAQFDLAVSYLLKQPRKNWKRPKAAKLSKGEKGTFREYFEIRFKANKLQQRPIGYFGPGDKDFTILIWATEKGNKLRPEAWRKKADTARENIGKNEALYATEFEFDD